MQHHLKCSNMQKHATSIFLIQHTAPKTIFSFSGRPEKMVCPKKLGWNMIFLVLSGKMIFLSPENMILHLKRKTKDDLSQKNTKKYFFKISEKMAFRKGAAPAYELSCIIWKDAIFFPKIWYFFPGQEMKGRPFPGNTWKHDIFCAHVRVLQTWRHATLSKKKKKIKDGLIPQKYI